MEQRHYKQAIQLLTALSQSPIAQQNLEHQGRVLDNLGYCYFKIQDSRSSAYLKKALAIHQQLQFDYGLITSYSNLAKYYQRVNPNWPLRMPNNPIPKLQPSKVLKIVCWL